MMKISVIIPTRERALYLGASIRTVLAAEDPDLELVVSDNASTDDTRSVVAGIDDPRLRYIQTEGRVSMRQNFNMALTKSTGDYVIFIGDDDAIVPGQLAALRALLERHRPDGVSWFKATYGWPVEGFGKKTGGIRFYRDDCFGAPQPYDPSRDIDALLACRLGALNPTPNIYHGCVSRAYLDRIAPAPGLYFDGTIPDVNFQFRAIFMGGSFLHCRHPFTINGYGPVSTGGAHAAVKAGSPGERIGAAFAAENRADPYDDIIDHALTVQLVYFSTLETLRLRSGFEQHRPVYEDWYQFALNAARMKPEAADHVADILDAHAARTGTADALTTARARTARAKRTLGERLSRARAQISSFRLSASVEGENTVETAAEVCDYVLGQNFRSIMDGTLSRSAAWRAARKRSRAFVREL